MTKETLPREAKALVALAFRNGPIEDLHAGAPCAACQGRRGVSRISDAEMAAIMRNTVDRLFRPLRMREEDPEGCWRQMRYGARCAAAWDEPDGSAS